MTSLHELFYGQKEPHFPFQNSGHARISQLIHPLLNSNRPESNFDSPPVHSHKSLFAFERHGNSHTQQLPNLTRSYPLPFRV
jgi:hypothetical protein